jgi:tetratricopeptide (TPR) repeat protein
MNEPFAFARLSEITSQDGAEGSTWLRIRRHFGIEAFGVNAYTAPEAGGRVIEDHDETGSSAGRHQELYFVVTGHARFTVGGEEIDAPSGTFVFVGHPETRRGAIAEEARTTVLVIGGKAGEPFEVSPWEAFADAWPHYQQKDYARAAEVLRAGVERFSDSASGLYNLACCESLLGEREAAIEHLGRAVEIDERFREYAQNDADLDAIRDDRRFPSAVAGQTPAAGESS